MNWEIKWKLPLQLFYRKLPFRTINCQHSRGGLFWDITWHVNFSFIDLYLVIAEKSKEWLIFGNHFNSLWLASMTYSIKYSYSSLQRTFHQHVLLFCLHCVVMGKDDVGPWINFTGSWKNPSLWHEHECFVWLLRLSQSHLSHSHENTS